MKKILLFILCAAFVLCIGNLNAQQVRKASNQEMSKATESVNALTQHYAPEKGRDLIYSEGFENTSGTALPTGWTVSSTGIWETNTDVYNMGFGSPGQYIGDNFTAHTGSRMFGRCWQQSGNNWAFSAGFDLAAGSTYTVSFYYCAPGYAPFNEKDDFEVKIGDTPTASGMASAFELYKQVGLASGYPYEWFLLTKDFTPSSSGTYYLGFHDLTPSGGIGMFIVIDDIEVNGSGNVPDPCPAVTNVTANVYEATKVKVTWTAPAKALANFEIYQDGTKTATVPAGTTEWISEDLASGTYTFAVAAVFEAADDCNPVKVAASPVEIKTCDGKVSNLNVEYATDCGTATITWDAPGGNPQEYKYNVYRDGVKIAGPIEETTFDDKTFAPAAGHTWSVAVACANGGDGEWVNVNKTSCTPCPPVTNLEIEFNECIAATLKWTAVAGAEGYKVLRDGTLLNTVTTNSYTDEFEFEDMDYKWEVITVCGSGSEAASAEITSNCLKINDMESNFSIVPNPATDVITINSTYNIKTIEVINFLGQTVISQHDNNRVDVAQLTNGIYFVRVAFENGISVQKFVKK